MKQLIPLDKQSKRARKEYHKKFRNTWGTLNPVTRTVPNGKAYDRNKEKRTSRVFRDEIHGIGCGSVFL